jgi:1-acyl-sn-glycerol-3-phosphate acyltransferase/DNA-directed RNA polymerase subunit RPC12/RpoP
MKWEKGEKEKMKISDIEYRTFKEVEAMKRFDLKSMPKKAKWYLQVLAWALSIPETFIRGVKIEKINMDKVKGPYVLLCNHNSFFDFKVATRAFFPRRANYVVAVDGFINREGLMRNVGCLGKRKFVADPAIVKQLKHTLEVNKSIAVIYPEARYSLIGTTAILPDSLGKLIKMFKFPVVTLISHGHHLHEPVWNLIKRKVPVKSVMTYLFTKDDLEKLSLEEINEKLRKAFYYNDHEYQLKNNIKIKGDNRAKNLHKVLYRCPHCLSDNTMNSENNYLFCENCHHKYYVDENYKLSEVNGETKFDFIPNWFEWQREEVKKEIESGKYDVAIEVDIDSLPNSTGYYRLGKGLLKHNELGFILSANFQGEDFKLHKPVLSNYGVHIEFEYFGKGDCLSFSTNNDTYYLYPIDKKYPITKFHFAVEELYKKANEKSTRDE